MPSPQDEDGAQARSNEHVDRMGQILLTYNFYEKELGMWRGTRLFPYIPLAIERQNGLLIWCLVGLKVMCRACRICARRSMSYVVETRS